MIDNIIIVIYLAAVLFIGLYSSKKVHSFSDFALSGRNYHAFIIFATLSASFIGGGFSTGNAAKVFSIGIANIVFLWGFSIKEIIVAKWIVPRMSRFHNIVSAGDMMGQAYGKPAKILTGIFSIFICAGILGAQVGAMGDVFRVFTGMDRLYGILIGCGIAILYSTFGGMRAVIVTDVIQFILLSIGMFLVLIVGTAKVGGPGQLFQDLPQGHLNLIPAGMTIPAAISLFLSFMLGETLIPPYVQRLLIGKNLQETAKGTLWSGIFSFGFFAVTGLIGIIAYKLDPTMNANHAIPNAIKLALPVGLRSIVIAGVISIVMSSADSFLNSAAVAFTNDIFRPLYTKSLSMKQELICARLINVITGIAAVVFAVKIPNALDVLLYAYTFWSPAILVPLVAAIWGVPAKPMCWLTGTICGIAGTILWKYVLADAGQIDGLIVGIAANFIGFTIAYQWQKRHEKVSQ